MHLSLFYKELHRVVEPYLYGMHKNGQQVLYCYQVDGESLFEEPGWCEFYLYKVHDLQILTSTFERIRQGYRMNLAALEHVYCEVGK